MKYIVSDDGDLIKFLVSRGLGKNKIKNFVKLGFVYVNGKRVNKLPIRVIGNDFVVIKKEDKYQEFDILYEDNNYLIVDKENGLLTISSGKDNDEDTLYKRVRYYLNKKHEYCFIVNRIDKETSGIVLFVKNEKLKNSLQSDWNNIVKSRRYIAIVSGKLCKSGRIDNYLYEDKMTFSHSTKIGGKRAITNYKPIKYNNKYTMLDINIETGRKNQIRVHLSEMGYPIIGDKKYHCKDNSLKRLCLHHYELSFVNPIDGKLLTVRSEVPDEFNSLFS